MVEQQRHDQCKVIGGGQTRRVSAMRDEKLIGSISGQSVQSGCDKEWEPVAANPKLRRFGQRVSRTKTVTTTEKSNPQEFRACSESAESNDLLRPRNAPRK